MNRLKVWLLALGGIALPVALVFTSVFINRELNASATVPGLDDAGPAAVSSDRRSDSRGPGEGSDRCSEPGHATNDCMGTSGSSPSSDESDPSGTSGSGSSGSSGSGDTSTSSGTSADNSGPSDNSGSGSDNSGSGSTSSGSGSSGSGGDDGTNSGSGSDD
ncbi:MAG: hypothetical protein ABR518_08125 [Actinomycetota bacterium]